jgi:hypothetical protein
MRNTPPIPLCRGGIDARGSYLSKLEGFQADWATARVATTSFSYNDKDVYLCAKYYKAICEAVLSKKISEDQMNSKLSILTMLFVAFTVFISCANAESNNDETELPNVYFTTDLSSAGLMAVYDALGITPTGNIAVKIHSGEPGNQNFIRPVFMAVLVKKVNGTFVETNVAYGSRRQNTSSHYSVAKEHGWTAVAPFVVLDGDGEISLPISGGKHLRENLIGEKFDDFDFHLVISHFKGHMMGGFGGALKNLSIGYASASGKALIHTHGQSKTNAWVKSDQISFLEAMAESAKSIVDRVPGRIAYINIMDYLSVDCDCDGNASPPIMAGIGILASLDPVALDQACIDLIYKAHDGHALIQRIESRHGLRTIERAEEIGVGRRAYTLVEL